MLEIIQSPKPLYLPASEIPKIFPEQTTQGYYKIDARPEGGMSWEWQGEPFANSRPN